MTKMKIPLLLTLLTVLTIFSSCRSDLKDEIDELKNEKKALQAMANNRNIERYISLVYGYSDDLVSYTWQHQYSEDYKLITSIRNSTNIYGLNGFDIQFGQIDGQKSQQIIEHKYDNGKLAQSISDEGSIIWVWENEKVKSFESKLENASVKYFVEEDQLLVSSSEAYENDILTLKTAYDYYENKLIKSRTNTDSQGKIVSTESYEYNKQTLLTSYLKKESAVLTLSMEWDYNDAHKIVSFDGWDDTSGRNKKTTIKVKYNTDGSYIVDFYETGSRYPNKMIITYNSNGIITEKEVHEFTQNPGDSSFYTYKVSVTTNTLNKENSITDQKISTTKYDNTAVETDRYTKYYDNITWEPKTGTKVEYTYRSYSGAILKEQTEYKYVNKSNEKYLEYTANWTITNNKALFINKTALINTYFTEAPFAPKTKTITTKNSKTAIPIITFWTNSENRTWGHNWTKDQ